MAQRRMFSKRITNTDLFLEMPLSAQALYFHLNMEADDDGFIDKARTIQRTIGASEDDMRILVTKQFILPFDNGLIVIKHWRIHNYIRKDTYQPTLYQEEKALIESQMPTDQKKLPKDVTNSSTSRRRNVDEPSTSRRRNVDTGKDRIGKESLGEDREYIYSQANSNEFTFPAYLTEKSITSIQRGKEENYPYKVPIAYLNQVTGRNYQYTDRNLNPIKARFKEGYSLDDFKKVIDIKLADWGHQPDMVKYLRPETLFGTKFDGYLNQGLPPGCHQQEDNDINERLGI